MVCRAPPRAAAPMSAHVPQAAPDARPRATRSGNGPSRAFVLSLRVSAAVPAAGSLLRLSCSSFAFALSHTRSAGWHPPARDALCSLESRGLRAVPPVTGLATAVTLSSNRQQKTCNSHHFILQSLLPITPIKPIPLTCSQATRNHAHPIPRPPRTHSARA